MGLRAQTTHWVTVNFGDGAGTFKAAVDSASTGDTIQFDASLFQSGVANINILNTPQVDVSLTIYGGLNRTVILNGNGSHKILEINLYQDSSGFVELNNVDFHNGFNYSSAGAVYAYSVDSLSIVDCEFKNNRTDGNYAGGAIYAYKTNVYTLNSLFEENYSSNAVGGAISLVKGNLDAKHTHFIKNRYKTEGGAISAGEAEIRMTNCVLDSNYSTHYSGGGSDGGGIHATLSSLFIENTEFVNNYGSSEGGAIFLYGFNQILHVKQSYFHGNYGNIGGAIHYAGDSALIEESTFYNNSGSQGGALWISGGTTKYVRSCTFFKNHTDVSAGGIYVGGCNADINACTFLNNTTANNTGSIELVSSNNSTLYLKNSLIYGNATNEYAALAVSNGYNAFQHQPTDAIASDTTLVDSLDLHLAWTRVPGSFAPVLLPSSQSLLVNTGAIADNFRAQNRFPMGRRDIGAAETFFQVTDTLVICSPRIWRDTTVQNLGMYTDSVYAPSGDVDSVYTLTVINLTSEIVNNGGTLQAVNPIDSVAFQWMNASLNSILPGETFSTFTPGSNGQYALIQERNWCSDTSEVITVSGIGTIENEVNSTFRVFPNPAEDHIIIEAQGEWNIYNTLGQPITSGFGETSLRVSNWPSGVYIAVNRKNGTVYSTTFIVRE